MLLQHDVRVRLCNFSRRMVRIRDWSWLPHSRIASVSVPMRVLLANQNGFNNSVCVCIWKRTVGRTLRQPASALLVLNNFWKFIIRHTRLLHWIAISSYNGQFDGINNKHNQTMVDWTQSDIQSRNKRILVLEIYTLRRYNSTRHILLFLWNTTNMPKFVNIYFLPLMFFLSNVRDSFVYYFFIIIYV